MAVVEGASRPWLSRLRESIKPVAGGAVLVIGSIVLLFWNEGRAVRIAKTIAKDEGICVSLDPARAEPANEGKLVHLSGKLSADETLADKAFGVSAAGAVKLRRTVQMYQWQQRPSSTEKQPGGAAPTVAAYTYTKVWSEKLIDSSTFQAAGYDNPRELLFTSHTLTAKKVALGAFVLPRSLVEKIDNYQPLTVTQETLRKLPAALRGRFEVRGGAYYRRAAPVGGTEPRVGDIRVTFAAVRPGPVSIVSKQIKNTFEPYRLSTDRQINWLAIGTHSAADMFATRRPLNVKWIWILRGAGFVVMLLGLMAILQPLVAAADGVPVIGHLLGMGAPLASLVIAAVLSLAAIAARWLLYRPLWTMVLLALAAAIFAGALVLRTRLRKGPSAPPPPPAAPPDA